MSPAPTTPALDRLLGFAARAADPAGGFASLATAAGTPRARPGRPW